MEITTCLQRKQSAGRGGEGAMHAAREQVGQEKQKITAQNKSNEGMSQCNNDFKVSTFV